MSILFEETIAVPINNDFSEGFVHICLEKDDGNWDEVALCGSKEVFHNKSCPGYHETWLPGETSCPHCGMPICPDCIFINEIDDELEGFNS
jgi:hypothetical protein